MMGLRRAFVAVSVLAVVVWVGAACWGASPVAAAEGAGHGAEAAGHEAAGGHAEKPGLLDFDPGAAIWSIVVFLALLVVLGRFAWKPMLKGLQDREQHIRESIERAEKSQADAEKLLSDYKEQMVKARDEAQAVIDAGKANAEKIKDELVEAAREETAAIKRRAEADISAAKDEALQEIWDTTAVIATDMAGKIVSRTLNPDDHRDLIQDAMSRLEGRDLGRS